jgi:hypothetical protein
VFFEAPLMLKGDERFWHARQAIAMIAGLVRWSGLPEKKMVNSRACSQHDDNAAGYGICLYE